MENYLRDYLIFPDRIQQALNNHAPIVALESAVLTHGLPRPINVNLAKNMEAQVRGHGVEPATIAVLEGKVIVGASSEQIEFLGVHSEVQKISNRDFAPAITLKWSGGTTVAGTLLAANQAGIRVFATGGIGGVHRGAPFDISADLPMLAQMPVIVVCAGAKAILDLPATLEYLETWGIPVLGFQTDQFPAFFSRESGLKVSVSVDSTRQVAEIARTHWHLGQRSAVLVTVPPPETDALEAELMEIVIHKVVKEAESSGIHGKDVTPFLLSRVNELTQGQSLKANLALLLNNANIAARIALELSQLT